VTIASTGRLTRRVVRASCRRPRLTIAASLLLAALAAWYTVHALDFRPDTLDLLPPDAPYVERWREVDRAFGQFDDIIVVVEAPSPAVGAAYVERLHDALVASPLRFPRVAHRLDAADLPGRGLLYLTLDELRALREAADGLAAFAADPALPRLVETVSARLGSAIVGGFLDLGLEEPRQPLDPAFLRVLLSQIDGRLHGPEPYRSPWRALLPSAGPGPDGPYLLSDDGRLHLVLVEPPESDEKSFTMDRAAMEAIRGAIAELRPAFPDVRAGVTGGTALSHDEMTTAFQDSRRAAALGFALILCVMLLAFRRLAKPLVLLAVLIVSLTWSLGAATLLVGHLTLFSVMFISVVAGIGVDYGIYVLLRYEDELRAGGAHLAALEATAARTGPLVVLSALTAAGTFYVLGLTDFPGIQELGVIAGSAILLACLGMLTLLPALLVLVDRRPRRPAPARSSACMAS
jgi:uncharacterized protein